MRPTILALALVGSCGAPVAADPGTALHLSPAPSGNPTFIPSDDPNTVGHIVVRNKQTYGNSGINFMVVETPVGDVRLEYNHTPNNACPVDERPCDDTLEVVEVPSGHATVPPYLVIEEGGQGTIRILPILGF